VEHWRWDEVGKRGRVVEARRREPHPFQPEVDDYYRRRTREGILRNEPDNEPDNEPGWVDGIPF
jgi:hypothetical protein